MAAKKKTSMDCGFSAHLSTSKSTSFDYFWDAVDQIVSGNVRNNQFQSKENTKPITQVMRVNDEITMKSLRNYISELEQEKSQLIECNQQQRNMIKYYEDELNVLTQDNAAKSQELDELTHKLNTAYDQKLSLKKENIIFMEIIKSFQTSLQQIKQIKKEMDQHSNRINTLDHGIKTIKVSMKDDYDFTEQRIEALEKQMNESTPICNKCKLESYALQNVI